MRHRTTWLLLCLLMALVGCTWTAPGPTYTPWPTPTSTAQPSDDQKGPQTVSTMPPEVPVNPAERNQMFSAAPELEIDPSTPYTATIKTAKGDIILELYADKAPLTVNNFVFLSRAGFYDGLTFHRVVPGFVIQGGDPLGKGNGGPGYTIPAEIGLPHNKGAAAMARLSDQVNPERESSGSQFYITLDQTSHLDGAYTVFGQIVEGMPVVESIVAGDVIDAIVVEGK